MMINIDWQSDHTSFLFQPSLLAPSFLFDLLDLPSSYYEIGADIKFQDFIIRWGRDFVKSAKFGGELKITKTATKSSKITEEVYMIVS